MFLSLKNIPKVSWSSERPLNLRPKISTFIFLCFGLTLFGSHTTAHKVSIEREKFKPIQVSDLNKLSAEKVFEKIEEKIN